MDNYKPPYTIKIINNFLDEKYYNFLNKIIEEKKFYAATQGVNGKQIVDEKHKIRLDYTLSKEECSYIDIPLIEKLDCGCNLRERWRLLYYNGDNDKKSFRDAHTDWTNYSCHRRMSVVIGLTDPNDYDGGELVFKNNNLVYKIGKGSAVVFDSKLLHEVTPVTKGKRYVLQSFLFDESGWNIKKIKNGKENFALLKGKNEDLNDYKINDNYIINSNYWIIKEGQNAIHSKLSTPEKYYLGTFTTIGEVIEQLKKRDAFAFVWHKPTLNNKKYAGKAYIFDFLDLKDKSRETMSSWIKENHVVSGLNTNKMKENCIIDLDKKYYTSDRYLSIISTDGGPGNQIVGIKEGLIMAKHLNRKFIFPPIIQHYVKNIKLRGGRDNMKHWDFDEIFNYHCDYPKINLMEYMKNTDTIKNCYCLNNKYINSQLRAEKLLELNNKQINKIICPVRKFENKDDYFDLNNLSDNCLLLHNLYNNTSISKCFWNGCDICELNDKMLLDYIDVCSKFDYSDKIKTYGDEYIKDNFYQDDYISIHIRYPDMNDSDNIKDINGLYDEQDIYEYIINLCSKNNISINNVFIATSNQKRIHQSCLRVFKLLESKEIYDEQESFIEQYICSKSKIFIYTGGDNAKPNHTHLRSTWSSFVVDYRNFYLKKYPENNIYLSKIFNK